MEGAGAGPPRSAGQPAQQAREVDLAMDARLLEDAQEVGPHGRDPHPRLRGDALGLGLVKDAERHARLRRGEAEGLAQRLRVQARRARGIGEGEQRRPAPPPPLWRKHWLEDQSQVSQTSPKLLGRAYTDYGVSWNYQFEADEPLVAVPNLFPI